MDFDLDDLLNTEEQFASQGEASVSATFELVLWEVRAHKLGACRLQTCI